MVPFVLLAGCPKPSVFAVDPALPEERTAIAAEQPLALLERGADSLEPGPRARALALLVKEGDDPAHWGARALLDPSDWVRRGAVDALGRREDQASRSLLEGVAGNRENDPYLRAMAALGSPGAVSSSAMSVALSEEQQAWRIAPLALAAVRLGDAQAHDALLVALANGELALDLAFVEEIGRSADPTLVPALEKAQGRVEDELVLPVAAARLMLGDPMGEQALRKALTSPDEERRLEALDYLVILHHPAAEALLRKASADGPELVTWYAELALAARSGGDPELFERAFRQPDRELRALAVRFAGEAVDGGNKRADKVARRVVVEGLADPDAAVRIQACQAVGKTRLAEARGPTEGLLTDEVELVRIEASGALLALRPGP